MAPGIEGFREPKMAECPESIAIVGMGCRWPGDIQSPSELWEFLINKRSARSAKVPLSRFNIDAHFHPNLERPGSFNVPGGYFLEGDLRDFDPSMFGISPVEAMWLDPQQRKLLEVVYECMETAGVTLEAVSGSRTGCFVGTFTNDYQQMSMKEQDFRHSYAATGVDPGLISNRVSHVFNLKGPSFTINTACSSSLYALHQACNALRAGECGAAIVGGTNLILTVDQHLNTAKLGVLSPTSQCHTFNAHASGYGRGEGVGAFYLKRLTDALRDGDPIRAVIRGSAVNSNGRVHGAGITHPSLEGQANVIREAYRLAGGLDPLLTGFFECHGTGTAVGDPLEVEALSKVMSPGRKEPLIIGAVKASIGHCEAASGIAAVMKAVLAVESGIIPPTYGFTNPNPNIKWNEWNVKVNTECMPWPENQPFRRASVNSFGYGGTNAHVIVESLESVVRSLSGSEKISSMNWKLCVPAHNTYRASLPSTTPLTNGTSKSQRRTQYLLPFSAHEPETLKNNIRKIGRVAATYDLEDLAFTLSSKRSKQAKRAFAVVNQTDLTNQLDLQKGDLVVSADSADGLKARAAFIFTGQGAQWPQMGAALMSEFPTFCQTIRDLDAVLAQLSDAPSWTLESAILASPEESRIHEVALSQPLCTAIQVGLFNLLQSWNIKPAATVGHSSGEIAAAYGAGHITAAEAIIVAYYRGKVVSENTKQGTMLAVGLGPQDITPYLAGLNGEVVVACQNSSKSVTLSGNSEKIHELSTRMTARGVFNRVLKTDGRAYHSQYMSPCAAPYESLVATAIEKYNITRPKTKSTTPMISSVTGEKITEIDSGYWSRNLTGSVLFDVALGSLLQTDKALTHAIEIGPHGALSGPVRQIISDAKVSVTYESTLKRGSDGAENMLSLAGKMFLKNFPVDLVRVNSNETVVDGSVVPRHGQCLVDLPHYQWTYKKILWAENRWSQEQRFKNKGRHDLLGRMVFGVTDIEPVWRNILRNKDLPWLKDHQIGPDVIFPGAGHWAMAIEAMTQIHEDALDAPAISGFKLRDVNIQTALVIPDDDEGIEVVLNMRKIGSEAGLLWYGFSVKSIKDDTWTEHSSGSIAALLNPSTIKTNKYRPAELGHCATGKRWYKAFREVGFNYGPSFQGVEDIRTDPACMDAIASIPVRTESGVMTGESRYTLHPSTIDNTLQLALISIYSGRTSKMSSGYVPTKAKEITVHLPKAQTSASTPVLGKCFARTTTKGVRSAMCVVQLTLEDQVLLEIDDLRVVAYDAAVPQRSENVVDQPYWQSNWIPDFETIKSTKAAQALLSGLTAEEQLMEVSRLLLVKQPDLRVLRLVGEEGLRGSFTPSENYVVAYDSDEALEAAQENRDSTVDFDELLLDELVDEKFDLIICDIKYSADIIAKASALLAPEGRMGFTTDDVPDFQRNYYDHRLSAQFVVTGVDSTSMVLALELQQADDTTDSEVKEVIAVVENKSLKSLSHLKKLGSSLGYSFNAVQLGDIKKDTCANSPVILLLDEETPFLPRMQKADLANLKTVLDTAASITWVTKGELSRASRPEDAMVLGLRRSLCAERASLKLRVVDIDSVDENNCQTLIASLAMAIDDSEVLVKNGVMYVNRVIPHTTVNTMHKALLSTTAESIPFNGQRLTGTVSKGAHPTVEFVYQASTELPSGYVEVEVKAAGINHEDVKVLTGMVDHTNLSREFSGVITRVGEDVHGLKVGDAVCGISVNTYSTFQTMPAILCQKISASSQSDFERFAAFPVAYISAYHALMGLARIQEEESVLISSSTGFAGHIAISIAKAQGAIPYVLVDSVSEGHALKVGYGLTDKQILCSKDKASIEDDILTATDSAGFDVVFTGSSSYIVDLWRTIGSVGRLVQLGSNTSFANFDTSPFERGATFASIDIDSLFEQKQKLLSALWKRAYVYCSILPQPAANISVFSVGNITEGIKSYTGEISAGKHVVSYRTSDLIPVRPQKNEKLFSADSSYLLVGCLGGLGRSLSNWMIQRGANHLIFLSRSGDDKPEAARLIKEIRSQGVTATVIRGDVSSKADVEKVREVSSGKIRGIVQAATVFEDVLFDSSTIENFHRSFQAKVAGTKNLHQVFMHDDLDFFIMTSSISATLGTPGQTNYAAGNSYLDYLARHRRSLGLPATSLILPMILGIGYVSERPEIEEGLTRKGLYGIEEEEVLMSFELAVRGFANEQPEMIVGMDPARLSKALQSGTTSDPFWFNDPRLRSIRSAITASNKSLAGGAGGKQGKIADRLRSEFGGNAPALLDAATEHIMDKLSRMMLIPLEEINAMKSAQYYGVDSSIGTELRNWLFNEFEVDLSIQTMLSPSMSLHGLAAHLCTKNGLVQEEQ